MKKSGLTVEYFEKSGFIPYTNPSEFGHFNSHVIVRMIKESERPVKVEKDDAFRSYSCGKGIRDEFLLVWDNESGKYHRVAYRKEIFGLGRNSWERTRNMCKSECE